MRPRLRKKIESPQKVIIIFILIGMLFSLNFTNNLSIKAETTTVLTIDNFQNGDTLHYDLPLLKGTAPGSQYVEISSSNIVLKYRVDDGHWRGFFPLQTGSNDMILATSDGKEYSFNLSYQPMNSTKFVRLVYPMGSDSNGSFDAPLGSLNDLSEAIPRIRLSGRILQSMTAELLYEKGMPRKTFNLVTEISGDPRVDTPHVSKTVGELRNMEGIDLWYYFYNQFSNIPNRNNIIDMAIMADSHYDPDSGTLQAHTALGGGRLGLFGNSTIYSFPKSVGDIEYNFTNTNSIEPYLNPEYGRAYEYWATYTTSLGAILHEMGHCFGLPHPDVPTAGDIMWRGFDYLNRLAVTYEHYVGSIDPNLVTMPRWTDQDVGILQANTWLYLADENNGSGGPQLIPGTITSSMNPITIFSETSNPLVINQPIEIEISWQSVSWTAQTDSQSSLFVLLDKSQGNSGETLTITIAANGFNPGIYTNNLIITASDNSILGSPMVIPIKLIVVDQISRNYLPLITR